MLYHPLLQRKATKFATGPHVADHEAASGLRRIRPTTGTAMPILAKEQDLYPFNLLDRYLEGELDGQQWWALYTLSRREKELMRCLRAKDIAFYSPLIAQRHRSPAGRIRTSHVPLFASYVFLCGSDFHRHEALTTNCVSRHIAVPDGRQLATDLRRIRQLIEVGHPLTPEAQLRDGIRVRVQSGPFTGFEGVVIRRENFTRLLVAVKFMQQGASVLLEDCELERLDP
jgi:transcriptional antiterminator RfaH